MSISDILAIRNLLPDSGPDFLFKPEKNKKLYKFRDKADQLAASAEVHALVARLSDEFGDDEKGAAREFGEMIREDDRLLAVVLHESVNALYEHPRIQKIIAKQERAKKSGKAKL